MLFRLPHTSVFKMWVRTPGVKDSLGTDVIPFLTLFLSGIYQEESFNLTLVGLSAKRPPPPILFNKEKADLKPKVFLGGSF